MKRIVFFALSLAAAIAFVSVATAATPSGDIVSNGKAWSCSGPVNLASVTVSIKASDPSNDGVFLRSGCTGYIGSITVDQWHGDGIKIGVGAHDLEVGSITVHCYAHDAGKHQDGIQVMGGRNIRFDGGYVGCYSANDSQVLIHEGAADRELPTNVIFDKLTADPAGKDDPTAQAANHYGPGGAYGISNGQSASSGFTNLTLLTRSHLHDLYQGTGAIKPVWSFASVPPGLRASAGIHTP
jgi:hypothetical protein